MPSLNLDLAFFAHRKVMRLVSLAGRGAEANLIRLWCYCGIHHPENGSLTGYSQEEIESIADWRGKPGVLVEALAKSGWLDTADGGYVVHDWMEHQGHLYAYKQKGKAMAKARWDRLKNDRSMLPACSQHAASIAPSIAASNAPSMLQAMPEHSIAKHSIAEAKAFLPPTTPTPPLEVEPPPGAPRTEGEARTMGDMIGVPGDFAANEWHRAAGRGWVDSRGQQIVAWANFLKARWNDRQSTRSEVRRAANPKPEDFR